MKVTSISICALALASVASAQTIYSTSFDSSAGFTTGVLDGQNGWDGNTNYLVENSMARSGDQAVVWRGTGGTYVWPTFSYTGALPVLSEVYIFIDPQTANDERIFGLRMWGNDAGSNYIGSGGVTISSSGVIRSGDTYSELWNDSAIVGSFSNPTGRWIQVQMLYTLGANTVSVSVDGSSYSVDVATPLAELVDTDLFSDWRNTNVSSVAWFDDYSVSAVPEPATLLALGAGLAVVARRRRRK